MEKINEIKKLIEDIRPMLQQDGGDIEFVEFKDSIVYVNMRGACASCPSMIVTLKAGVESYIKEQLDYVKSVEQAPLDTLWKDYM